MRRRPRTGMMTIGTPRLAVPFPLRPDFIVTIEVPRDMTSDEAARLAAFVLTLAPPAKEGKP